MCERAWERDRYGVIGREVWRVKLWEWLLPMYQCKRLIVRDLHFCPDDLIRWRMVMMMMRIELEESPRQTRTGAQPLRSPRWKKTLFLSFGT